MNYKKIHFYNRPDHADALRARSHIEEWIAREHPEVKISDDDFDVVIVIGGDGTIMEAARKYNEREVIMLGINVGRVGFLASIQNPDTAPTMLEKFFSGDFKAHPGMIIRATVMRDGKEYFTADAFNEIVVQNPLGMVELVLGVNTEMMEEIRGSGVLVATPSGSTAYNLSLHGPIIAPTVECFIITELCDHDIPTPSLVVSPDETVNIVVQHFREHKLLKLARTSELLDVVMIADGVSLCVLQKGDEIHIVRRPSAFSMTVLEPNYFYKNLRSKFSF